MAYCKWRTVFVNEHIYAPYYPGVKVNYRLATPSEMKKIVAYEKEAFKKRSAKIRDKISGEEYKEGTFALIPTGKRARGRWKGNKKNRIYSLFHNATEMSSVKGVAFGMTNESFDPSGDMMPKVIYDGPSPDVGFRCVAEYLYDNE